MRYAFVIDNRRCIGCHACSVACKAENGVPLGVFRTWVKYVEKGAFPNTRRHFQVTRCNHCASPPCAAICPVGAIFQRRDGIVDFDPERCIGCKACMQACPYDAIHLDPQRRTAAKCNFCAQRVDSGLLPICAAACPAEAILVGDLDDPRSRVSGILAREKVAVRKPEQGTRPMLFYVGAEQATVVPGAAANPGAYLWSGPNPAFPSPVTAGGPDAARTRARVVYDVDHARPWGWQIPAYFWTKSISAGVFVVPALAYAAGIAAPTRAGALMTGGLALLFLAVTLALLVSDLARPERCLRALTKPRGSSWVARGAWIILLYGGLAAAYTASALADAPALTNALLIPTAVGGVFAAIYTAFLLGQCEGRDLWQTPLLPLHLVVQSVLAGTAVLMLVPGAFALAPGAAAVARWVLAVGLAIHTLGIVGELATRASTDNARQAGLSITRGAYRALFFTLALGVGVLLPLLVLLAAGSSTWGMPLAAGAVLAGLLAYEWCFVMGGQSAPNS